MTRTGKDFFTAIKFRRHTKWKVTQTYGIMIFGEIKVQYMISVHKILLNYYIITISLEALRYTQACLNKPNITFKYFHGLYSLLQTQRDITTNVISKYRTGTPGPLGRQLLVLMEKLLSILTKKQQQTTKNCLENFAKYLGRPKLKMV